MSNATCLLCLLEIDGRRSRDGHSVCVDDGDVGCSLIIRIIRHGSVKCRVVVSELVVDFGSGVACPLLRCQILGQLVYTIDSMKFDRILSLKPRGQILKKKKERKAQTS